MAVAREDSPPHRFSAARTIRTFDAIVEQVAQAIISGIYTEGDRLPSQRDLAEQFGVSRNGVLQALRVLERQGLVEIRQGASGGAFVRSLDGRQLGHHLGLLVQLDRVSMREMREFRWVLEGQNAFWAATRSTTRDRGTLKRIVKRMGELLDTGPDGEEEAIRTQDVEFHVAVARAAHNRAALAVMEGVLVGLERELKRVPHHLARKGHEDLSAVVEAIVAQEPERARELMQRHIDDFYAVTHPRRSRSSA